MAWWLILIITAAFVTMTSIVVASLITFRVATKRVPTTDYSKIDEAHDKTTPLLAPFIISGKEWMATMPTEEVWIENDGLRLHGTYLPAEIPGKRAILCVHGYHSCGVNDFCIPAEFYHGLGFDLLMIDHRAHGESDGKYIGFGVPERFDCMKWLSWLTDRLGADATVYLNGVSMGATTVLMMSGMELPPQVRGIVADCGFTSPYDICSHVLDRMFRIPHTLMLDGASLISKLVAGYAFDDCSTLTELRKNTLPVLFVHGSADAFVPPEMSRMNFEATRGAKRLVIVEGAIHAASYVTDTPRIQAELAAFLK